MSKGFSALSEQHDKPSAVSYTYSLTPVLRLAQIFNEPFCKFLSYKPPLSFLALHYAIKELPGSRQKKGPSLVYLRNNLLIVLVKIIKEFLGGAFKRSAFSAVSLIIELRLSQIV